jgi:hypothetical protein
LLNWWETFTTLHSIGRTSLSLALEPNASIPAGKVRLEQWMEFQFFLSQELFRQLSVGRDRLLAA